MELVAKGKLENRSPGSNFHALNSKPRCSHSSFGLFIPLIPLLLLTIWDRFGKKYKISYLKKYIYLHFPILIPLCNSHFEKKKISGIFCLIPYHFSILYIHFSFLLWNNRIFFWGKWACPCLASQGTKSKEPQPFLPSWDLIGRRISKNLCFFPFFFWRVLFPYSGKSRLLETLIYTPPQTPTSPTPSKCITMNIELVV